LLNIDNLGSLYNSKYTSRQQNDNEKVNNQSQKEINVGAFGSIFKQKLEEIQKHIREDKPDKLVQDSELYHNASSSRIEMLHNSTSRPVTPGLNKSSNSEV
jgi:hypothetical protein